LTPKSYTDVLEQDVEFFDVGNLFSGGHPIAPIRSKTFVLTEENVAALDSLPITSRTANIPQRHYSVNNSSEASWHTAKSAPILFKKKHRNSSVSSHSESNGQRKRARKADHGPGKSEAIQGNDDFVLVMPQVEEELYQFQQQRASFWRRVAAVPGTLLNAFA
jgi:hypothetical protein